MPGVHWAFEGEGTDVEDVPEPTTTAAPATPRDEVHDDVVPDALHAPPAVRRRVRTKTRDPSGLRPEAPGTPDDRRVGMEAGNEPAGIEPPMLADEPSGQEGRLDLRADLASPEVLSPVYKRYIGDCPRM